MQRSQIAEIVRDAIDGAAKAKGWSLAQLARQLGMGETTLHRWRAGTNAKYDLGTLIKLFGMAKMSMDEEFGISRDEGEPIAGKRETEKLRAQIEEIKGDLELLRPLADVMRVIAQSAAAMRAGSAEPNSAVAARRAQMPRPPASALLDATDEAIALGDQLAKEGKAPTGDAGEEERTA